MKDRWFDLVLAAVALFFLTGGKLPVWNPIEPTPSPDSKIVIMLYESQHGPLPPYALGAAGELDAAGWTVRPTEDDQLTGEDQIPDWLKPVITQGREIMGGQQDEQQVDDALIIVSGSRVRAMKMPTSKPGILEAVHE